jgi:hypothetical protein
MVAILTAETIVGFQEGVELWMQEAQCGRLCRRLRRLMT